MSRKHNPIVALVALILMILLVLAVCAGCEEVEAAPETAAEVPSNRFTIEIELMTNKNGPDTGCRIITDTETGVQYLFYKDVNAGGLTKLEPAPAEEEAQT